MITAMIIMHWFHLYTFWRFYAQSKWCMTYRRRLPIQAIAPPRGSYTILPWIRNYITHNFNTTKYVRLHPYMYVRGYFTSTRETVKFYCHLLSSWRRLYTTKVPRSFTCGITWIGCNYKLECPPYVYPEIIELNCLRKEGFTTMPT